MMGMYTLHSTHSIESTAKDLGTSGSSGYQFD